MYDIVFLSYQEAKADEHWELLKARFPRAIRSHGVPGIVAAHKAAAAKCSTRFFWVVDADNVINPDFDFTFQWPVDFEYPDAVAVWRATNNVNGLVYGYGGVKLLPTRRVKQIDDSVVDFTTSIGKNFFVQPQVASTTIIDSTPFEAWKSGFRECAKLASSVIDRQQQAETDGRLATWCEYATGPYADEVIRGALEGRSYGTANAGSMEALRNLNDFAWLKQRYDAVPPETGSSVGASMDAILPGLADMYPEIPFLKSLRQTIADFPDARWDDAMSRGQIQSKRWLVDTLHDVMYPPMQSAETVMRMDRFWRTVYVCASWYGILGDMLIDKFGDRVGQVRGLDMDPEAVTVANRLMRHYGDGWKMRSTVKDIRELTYDNDELTFERFDGSMVVYKDTPSMVINTSCEHIPDFTDWYRRIPRGRLVVMQSNDYFGWHEHVNCVSDLMAFTAQTPMRTELFSGELPLFKYTRFMRIGIT